MQRSVDENSGVALDRDACNRRYDSLARRYETDQFPQSYRFIDRNGTIPFMPEKS